MLIPLLSFGGVAVIGGVVWFFFLRSKPPPEEPIYYYHCISCKRKLKYYGRQANSKGMCPRCKQRFVFPAVPKKETRR